MTTEKTGNNGVENPDKFEDLDSWIDSFKNKNEGMRELGLNFEYLMNNTEKFESNGIDPEDMPEGEEWFKVGCLLGACFGTSVYPLKADFFEVTDEDGFVGVFSSRREAEKRIDDLVGGNIRSLNIETDFDPFEFINDINQENPILAESFEKAFSYIDNISSLSHIEEVDNEFNNDIDWVVIYSVIFGFLWEKEVPSVYFVYDKTGVIRASTDKPSEVNYDKEGVQVTHLREIN